MNKKRSSTKASSQLVTDFERRKRKLGANSSTSSNSTNTSFKARSIALPQQSINRRNIDNVVGKRNLTLEQLLLQIRHPNANVRKEALHGLEELHQLHPGMHRHSHTAVLSNVIRVVSDEDKTVRDALLRFLPGYLRQLSSAHAQPYASLCLLHVTSAMSHIYPDVRLDAVRTMDVCFEIFGEQIATGWREGMRGFKIEQAHDAKQQARVSLSDMLNGQMASKQDGTPGKHKEGAESTASSHFVRILRAYLSILGISDASESAGAKTTSRTGISRASVLATDMSRGALLVVLKSILRFLQSSFGIRPPQRPDQEHDVLERDTLAGYAKSKEAEFSDVWFLLPFLSHESDCEALRGSKSACFISKQSPSTDAFFSEDRSRTDKANGQDAMLAYQVERPVDDGRVLHAFSACAQLKHQAEDGTRAWRSEEEGGGKARRLFRLALFELLSPLLLVNLMDAASIAFDVDLCNVQSEQLRTKAENSTVVDTLAVVVALALTCWRNVRHASPVQVGMLAKLLRRIAPHFPMPYGRRRSSNASDPSDQGLPMQEDDVWLDINLGFCELVSIHAELVAEQKASPSTAAEKAIGMKVSHVGQFVIQALRHGKIVHGRREGRLCLAQTRQSFDALLPSIWQILNLPGDDVDQEQGLASDLIDALLQHWAALRSNDSTKFTSTRFIGHLLQLEQSPSYCGHFRLMASSRRRSLIIRWLTISVPQLLWELNIKDEKFTGLLLDLLRWVAIWSGDRRAKQDMHLSWSQEVIHGVQKPLATFFHVQHHLRGSIDGPYVRSSVYVQRQAKALLGYMRPADPALQAAAQLVGALPLTA